MSIGVEVFPSENWAGAAATYVAGALPRDGVVIVTGGATAERLYPALAARPPSWSSIDVFFSDERCVPPDHPDSNYNMVRATLLEVVRPRTVHRMRGEDEPPDAAAAYDHEMHDDASELVADVLLLGMGDDGHVAGLFPNSPVLQESDVWCVAIDRPDRIRGLTLTRPALWSARRVLVIVTGAAKAGAIERALKGDESPTTCPVRMFADHSDATFLIDDEAATRL